MKLNLRLAIEVVENGYTVTETITVEEKTQFDESSYRHSEEIHVFYTATEVAEYIQERLEEENADS